MSSFKTLTISACTFLICLFTTGNINGQTTEARKYVLDLHSLVMSNTEHFNKIMSSTNRIEANQWIDTLKYYSGKYLAYLKKLYLFDHNTALKNSCVNYISHLNKISKKELPQLYKFYFNTKHTQKDVDDSKKLAKIIGDKTKELFDLWRAQIDPFEEKYGVVYASDFTFTFEEKTSFENDTAYNDYIVDRVDKMDDLWTLSIEEEDMNFALMWIDTLYAVSKRVVESLEKLGPRSDYDEFRLAAIEYAKHFMKIASNELPEFIKIIRAEEMTIEGENRAEAMLPELDDVREFLFSELEKKQFEFADLTHIEIEGRYEFQENHSGINYNYTGKNTFESAIEYNLYLANMVSIIDSLWTKTIEEENLKKALDLNEELGKKTSLILQSLYEMGPFKDDDEYRKSVVDYATHMNNISKNELKEFINIIRQKKMNSTAEARAEALLPILDDEREALKTKIGKAQGHFGEKFGLSFVNE